MSFIRFPLVLQELAFVARFSFVYTCSGERLLPEVYKEYKSKKQDVKKKKLNSPPSVPCHCICGNPEGNNSPVSVVYQSGEVLMDNGRRRSGF